LKKLLTKQFLLVSRIMGCISATPATRQQEKKQVVKKKAPAKKSGDSVILTPMKQDTVNDEVIEGMVKENDLAYEFQNQEMKLPELTKCFRCNGSGKHVA